MAALGLLKDVRSRTGTKDGRAVALTVRDIPVGDIEIRENVRKAYTGIEELAESIRQHGLLQPITVYKEGDGFVVKTGHRRVLACKLLFADEPERFHSIRCLVSDAENIAIIQLVENVQRVDLSPFDLYNALCALKEQGVTLQEIAMAMGKTEQYVKYLFVGVKEISANDTLKNALSYAGITIQDVVETKGIPDETERLNLLKQREAGEMNRATMRKQVRTLKDRCRGFSTGDSSPDTGADSKMMESSVQIAVSTDGLRIELAFVQKEAAEVVEKAIRKLLERQGLWVMDPS
jgi:ParB family chromosome partitioning protein